MFVKSSFWILFLLIFNSISGISNSQEFANPSFEDSIVILLKSSVSIAQPVISPNSRYVFAMTGTDESLSSGEKTNFSGNTALLSLWELDNDTSALELNPIKTFEIDIRAENVADYQFSPDSAYLALRVGNQLQLLTVPELTIEKSITLLNSRKRQTDVANRGIAWSFNGGEILVTDGQGIGTWNINEDIMYHYTGITPIK